MNIAIVGAAYTGLAATKYLKTLGHTVSVTTTKESRKEERSTGWVSGGVSLSIFQKMVNAVWIYPTSF